MEKSRLLSFASPVLQESSLLDCLGSTVGVDADSFAKSIFYALPQEFYFKDTKIALKKRFEEEIKILADTEIKFIFVFNGGILPNEKERLKIENDVQIENKKKAETLIQEGYSNSAVEYIRSGFKLDFEMTKEFKQILENQQIEHITAPFEALAELSYLASIGYVDFIYTENPRVFIYDPKNVILNFSFIKDKEDFSVIGASGEQLLECYGLTKDRFAQMCCIAGECYSLPVMNWNDEELLMMYTTKTPFNDIVELMREKNPNIPGDYAANVIKEVKSIYHQFVYDPINQQLTSRIPCKEPLPANYNKDEIMKVVRGEMNPSKLHEGSVFTLQWNSSAQPSPKRKISRKSSHDASTMKMASILSFFQARP